MAEELRFAMRCHGSRQKPALRRSCSRCSPGKYFSEMHIYFCHCPFCEYFRHISEGTYVPAGDSFRAAAVNSAGGESAAGPTAGDKLLSVKNVGFGFSNPYDNSNHSNHSNHNNHNSLYDGNSGHQTNGHHQHHHDHFVHSAGGFSVPSLQY